MVIPNAGLEYLSFSKAFYMAQNTDVRREPGSEDLSRYGFIVCNMDIDIVKLRQINPNAILAGYFSPWLSLKPRDDNQSRTGLFGWEESQYTEDDFWHDSQGNRIFGWSNNMYALRFNESVLNTKTTLSGLIIDRGFDVLFADDIFGELPDTHIEKLIGTNASSLARFAIRNTWNNYLKNLISKIKDYINVPIVGNVGDQFDYPNVRKLRLTGIYSEEWCNRVSEFQNEVKYRYPGSLCSIMNRSDVNVSVCRNGYQRRT